MPFLAVWANYIEAVIRRKKAKIFMGAAIYFKVMAKSLGSLCPLLARTKSWAAPSHLVIRSTIFPEPFKMRIDK